MSLADITSEYAAMNDQCCGSCGWQLPITIDLNMVFPKIFMNDFYCESLCLSQGSKKITNVGSMARLIFVHVAGHDHSWMAGIPNHTWHLGHDVLWSLDTHAG